MILCDGVFFFFFNQIEIKKYNLICVYRIFIWIETRNTDGLNYVERNGTVIFSDLNSDGQIVIHSNRFNLVCKVLLLVSKR